VGPFAIVNVVWMHTDHVLLAPLKHELGFSPSDVTPGVRSSRARAVERRVQRVKPVGICPRHALAVRGTCPCRLNGVHIGLFRKPSKSFVSLCLFSPQKVFRLKNPAIFGPCFSPSDTVNKHFLAQDVFCYVARPIARLVWNPREVRSVL
jgi:hypothetical protein